MNKKVKVYFAAAGCACMVLFGQVVSAAQTEAPKSSLSDNLYDFQIVIDGQKYQFPMPYQEFLSAGDWKMSSYYDEDMKVKSNSYAIVGFESEDARISAYVFNVGINECGVEDCLMGGIHVTGSESELNLADHTVELSKGITLGTSTAEDIQKAYGQPSDTYEGDLYEKFSYEKDIYQSIDLYVYKDDGTLKEVQMENLVKPDNYDVGTVSTEVPDIVTSYQVPEALGEDMLDPVVEYCNDLYRLPCPMSEFVKNGWEIQDLKEGDYLAGGDIGFYALSRDNQNIRVAAYNLTENATAVENCFVKELAYATYDNEALKMTISGNITVGVPKEEVLALAQEKGYVIENDDEEKTSQYIRIYRTDSEKLDRYVEYWINKSEEPDLVASVTYHNELMEE